MPPQIEAMLFRQFAALLRAGISVERSLEMVNQGVKADVRQKLQRVGRMVATGQDLGTAFTKVPGLLDPWTVNLIRVGEQSGALPDICEQLATAAEQHHRLQRLFRSVGVAAVSSLMGILALITFLMVGKPHFVLEWQFWLSTLLTSLTLVLISYQLLLVPPPQPWYERVLGIPIWGRMIEVKSLLYLTQLALPLSCGVSLLTSLDLVRQHIPDRELQKTLTLAIAQVRQGKSLSESLGQRLPNVALQMIRTGEETGTLDATLTKLAEYHEKELEELLRRLQGILRPVGIVGLGGLVLLAGIQLLNGLIRALPG